MATDQERARLLDEFKNVTGTTDDFALSFLDSSDWNLERATDLFLGGITTAPPARMDSSVEEEDQDRSEDELQQIMRQHNVDRATAAAIKEAGGGVNAAIAEDADGVRAPILQKRARLFDTVEQELMENTLAHDLGELHVGALDAFYTTSFLLPKQK